MAMSFLGILMSLIMALSGGAGADVPVARVETISDVVVTVDGEAYPLDVSAAFGVGSAPDEGVLDFYMTVGGETIFPMQAKVSDAGLSWVIGDASKAYTIDADYLESLFADAGDETAAVVEYMTSYAQLLTALENLDETVQAMTPEEVEAYNARVREIAGDGWSEEPISRVEGGEEIAGTRYAYAFDTEQTAEWLDYAWGALLPEDFVESYFGLANAMQAMMGFDERYESFSDLLDDANLGGVTYSGATEAYEDGAAVETGRMVMAMDAVTLRMDIDAERAADGSAEETVTINVDGYDVCDIEIESDGTNVAMTVDLDIPEMSMDIALDGTEAEDGSMTAEMRLDLEAREDAAGESVFAMTLVETAASDADGNTAADVAMTVALPEDRELGVSFHVADGAGEIPDRMADLEQVVIADDEAMADAGTSLTLSVAALAGDAEKLITDDSVVAMAEAVEAFFNSIDGEPAAVDPYEPENVSCAPEDLSFTVPEFGYVPAGYELSDTSANITYYDDYTTYEDLYQTFENAAGDYINVNCYRYGDVVQSIRISIDGDGNITAEPDQEIVVNAYSAGGGYAYTTTSVVDISVDWSGADVTGDDIAAMIAAMDGPEMNDAVSVAVIGGADGPTSLFVTDDAASIGIIGGAGAVEDDAAVESAGDADAASDTADAGDAADAAGEQTSKDAGDGTSAYKQMR